jgi:hypothetical protein
MELLRGAAGAVRCFNSNIVQPDIKPKFDRARDIKYAKKGQEGMEKCENALASLDASKIIAGSVLDDEVAQSIEVLRYSIDSYARSYDMILGYLRPDKKDYEPPASDIELINQYWAALGSIRIEKEEDEGGGGGPREPEEKMFLLQKDLERMLRTYLELEKRKNAPRGGGN